MEPVNSESCSVEYSPTANIIVPNRFRSLSDSAITFGVGLKEVRFRFGQAYAGQDVKIRFWDRQTK